ncbi:MAG TPA: LysR family transcriptional regulator [Polyangium sp.]|nr:LysR family transcriptional regulator [Polyangium sp.]
MFETSWLRAFASFAEHLNFTRAARKLHLSQPALFAQVQKLSDAVGTPLYKRVGRGLVLTEAGERMAAFARKNLAEQVAIVEELRTGRSRARVIVCAGEGAYLYLIGEAVQRSVRDARTPIELLVRDASETLGALRTGAAHIGVLPIEAVPARMIAEKLAMVGQMVVLPESHPLAQKSQLTLADLSGSALIVPPPGSAQRRVLEEALSKAGISWEIAVEARGWPLTIHLAKLGTGLAIVNDFCRLPSGLVGKPLMGLPSHTYCAVRMEDTLLEGAVEKVWKRLLAAKRLS